MKLSAESIVACSEQGFVQQRPGGFGMVLDCSSHVPLSSMPVSAGMFCPHQTAPLPHWRNLPGREEETLGGFLRSAWVRERGTCKGCSAGCARPH